MALGSFPVKKHRCSSQACQICSTKLEDLESLFKLLMVENSRYDPEQMVFMDYRDYTNQKVRSLEAEYPIFMSPMRIDKDSFFEKTCLASKDVMPFVLLKNKLMLKIRYTRNSNSKDL